MTAGGTNGDLLSIGELAGQAGISTDTIRMWERRYGRPVALRLPSGHRRYVPEQVRWLRRVAEALARGHRPCAVIPLAEVDLEGLLGDAAEPPGDRLEPDDLLPLVRAYSGGELRARLSREWEELGPREFLRRRLTPLCETVGRGWADGRISIRHEHFLSSLLEDFLRVRRHAGPEGGGPILLLAALPGERHGLGLQLAALVAELSGGRPRVLGVDTPATEIVAAARESGAVAVALSVSLATGGPATDRELASLRKELPAGVALIVGGAGARGSRRGPRGILYAETLAAFEGLLEHVGRGINPPSRNGGAGAGGPRDGGPATGLGAG